MDTREITEDLYRSGWLKSSINNICKKCSLDQKNDMEQYLYLYILEHPQYFEDKPKTEIQYYLIRAIQNQYNDLFRHIRCVVDSDYINKISKHI